MLPPGFNRTPSNGLPADRQRCAHRATTIRVGEFIGIVIGVPIAVEVVASDVINSHRINGEEPSNGGIVIALNTLTRRDSTPPTVARLDAARLGDGRQGRHAVFVPRKNPLMHFSPTRARRSRARAVWHEGRIAVRGASASDRRRNGQPIVRSALLPVAVSVGLWPTKRALGVLGRSPNGDALAQPGEAGSPTSRHRSGADSVSSLLTRFYPQPP